MKTILITGASSGIGKAAAKKFANEGWNVIATMRTPSKEQELTGVKNVFVTRLDVQDNDSILQAVQAGIDKFGRIDVLLNNAGMGVFGPFELATREQIRQQFDINVFGLMDTTRAVLPHFRANKAGTIINVSSMGGRVTFPSVSLYNATKFAIEGFSEALSYELIAQHIRLKIVEPGSTVSNFIAAVAATENKAITDYDAVNKISMDNWVKYDTMQSTSEEIAEVIFTAATDENDQLRYMAGKDTELYLSVRQGETDQEYVDYMRNRFIPEILSK
jgi:NAD(P)-dependent dehydrogenase (short-subunit alcohol dehydrogenase family)